MDRKSNVFKEGQRIEGTMLTILGPVEPSTWMLIRCLCDCGTEVVLSYHQVYYQRFSCGCKRRTRSNAVDYADLVVYNQAGNRHRGRKLSIVSRDESGQWWYLCHCCKNVSIVPRGMDTNLARWLKDLAGQDCADYRIFVPFNRVENLMWLIPDRPRNGRERMAQVFLRYVGERYTKRDPKGKILGFYVRPDETPRDYGCKYDTWAEEIAAVERSVERSDSPEQEKALEPDPDGFAPALVDATNDLTR